MEKSSLPECPVATTVQLIGSKWKLLVLRNLMSCPWRFNELKKDLNGISQKVLTDALRPVLMSMESWGRNYKNGLQEYKWRRSYVHREILPG